MSRTANKRFYRLDSMNEFTSNTVPDLNVQQENRWNFEIAWEAANKGNISLHLVMFFSSIIHFVMSSEIFIAFYTSITSVETVATLSITKVAPITSESELEVVYRQQASSSLFKAKKRVQRKQYKHE